MSETFGRKLNPYRRLRNSKGVSQTIRAPAMKTQLLTVRFPNLGKMTSSSHVLPDWL